jgi:lysyl-tRNA synthetase class 2
VTTPIDRRAALVLRSRITFAVRAFFHERGYLEVETPVRIRTPALELHIDAESSRNHWLRTSPELHMKRLLAEGHGPLFQVGPCFRRGEQGRQHHPEYTMLEWYRPGAGYLELVEEAEALVRAAAAAAGCPHPLHVRGRQVDLSCPWHRLTVSAAFLQHAGWDPCRAFDADRFDLDLVERVEPALPMDRPVVLYDYPPELAALARIRRGSPDVAERWELYIAGVELANAYGELTDPGEQRARFETWAEARRKAGRAVYDLDEPFLEALQRGLPACAGIALGLDRLVMVLADAPDLRTVTAFVET